MKKNSLTVGILKNEIGIVPVFRLHLPKYNRAAWELEGKYLYPQFKTFEEYEKQFFEGWADE